MKWPLDKQSEDHPDETKPHVVTHMVLGLHKATVCPRDVRYCYILATELKTGPEAIPKFPTTVTSKLCGKSRANDTVRACCGTRRLGEKEVQTLSSHAGCGRFTWILNCVELEAA